MPQIRVITSKDNPQYRYVKSLHERKRAEHEGVVFLEGVRLCEDALISGLEPVQILFSEDKQALVANWCERFALPENTPLYSLPEQLFARLGSTQTPQGVAIVVKSPLLSGELPVEENAMYLVCEGTSDPGNMGTMIRMADAFAFTAVLITEGTVDPFNEKAIRASMGSCFHIPIALFPSAEQLCSYLREKGVQLIASHLKGMALPEAEFSFPAALFIGNEARGLTEACAEACDMLVKIPMPGRAESLNASSAASILGYVLSSQRK